MMARTMLALVAMLVVWAASGCEPSKSTPKTRNINLLGDLPQDPTLPQRMSVNGKLKPAGRHGAVTNTIGMKLVTIEPGTFVMGSAVDEAGRQDDETPHTVTLTEPYYISTTEVTQGQWAAIMRTRPWHDRDGVIEGDDNPAVYVSWDDAMMFCRVLSAHDGKHYRLATEAEWEYACRAGRRGAIGFDGATALTDAAWCAANVSADKQAGQRVATKRANALGLYDMHGNVAEWCLDWYGPYPTHPVTAPTGPATGRYRIARGGAFASSKRFCRSAYRGGFMPDLRDPAVGFRVVMEP